MKGEEELRRLLNAHADASRHSVRTELTPNYQLKTSVRGQRCRIGCADYELSRASICMHRNPFSASARVSRLEPPAQGRQAPMTLVITAPVKRILELHRDVLCRCPGQFGCNEPATLPAR